MDRIKRWWIQLLATVGYNANLKGFAEGRIYQGQGKYVCVPGLNCYSCPGAVGSCPIGALQSVFNTGKYYFSFYVVGTLMLFGMLMGRFVCGWLCPFGWFQELLYKIKTRKYGVPRALKKMKYVILVVFVILLPLFWRDAYGLSDPTFCKYICPAGALEGGVFLVLTNSILISAIGYLYFWKMSLLAGYTIGSIFTYRPFCKTTCPLGAVYALFNPISLYKYRVIDHKCIECGQCEAVCKMDVAMYKDNNHMECIRCGDCKNICPTNAIVTEFKLGDPSKEEAGMMD